MSAWPRSSGELWGAARAVFNVLLCIFLVGPMIVVIIVSFSSSKFLTFPPPGFSLQWYEALLANPQWVRSFWVSIQIMVPTSILATAIGTAAAFGIHRGRGPVFMAVGAAIMAPLVIPGIIVAAAIYGVFRAVSLDGTLTGFIIAHTALTVPFVVATVLPSIRLLDERLELAAYTLGATPAIAYRRIVLPLILPSIVSGLLFAMVICFDELIVSLFLSKPRLQPVAVRMYSDVLGNVDPTISAIGTLIFAFATFVLFVDSMVRGLQARRLGNENR